MTTEQKHRPFNACCIDWRLDAENAEEERDTLAAKVKELKKKLDDQGFEYADKIQILEAQLRYLAAVSQQYIDHVEGLSPAFTGDQEYDDVYREGLSEDMRIAIDNALAKIEAEKQNETE